MSVALVAQNKTKISFFLGANFLLYCRHKQKTFSGGIVPDPHQGSALEPLVDLQPDAQLYVGVLHALLSVHLNKRSIKKTLIRPLVVITQTRYSLLSLGLS